MRRLTLVLLVACLAGTAFAAAFETMPPELKSKWRSSLSAASGWNECGYDTAGWVPVVYDLATAYPNWMTPAQQARHQFMWHPAGNNNGQLVYFRRQLWIDGRVTDALFRVCADDQFRFFVNGRLVGGARESGATRVFAATSDLLQGANVLAAEARDTMGQAYGLLVMAEVTQEWPFVPEEHRWRCSTTAGDGWTTVGYNDDKWGHAVPDRAPAILVDSRRYSCFTTPQDLPDFGTAYFRRTLDLDGVPVSAQVTILGDDSYQLYVNGELMALEGRADYAYRPRVVDVGSALHPGRNILAVKITNTWGPARLYCAPVVKMIL